MTKLWRLTRVLVLVCGVGLGGVRLIGSRQFMSFATLFTNPDMTPCQRPCLFGVRPGKTSYQAAIRLVQLHPFTSHFAPDLERGVFSGSGMTIILFDDGRNAVSRIDLVRTPDSVLGSWASLGEVVTVLGAPEVVGVETDSTRSYYLDSSMMFFHGVSAEGYISPEDRFDGLFVFARPPTILSERNLAAWSGFSSVQHYREKWKVHPD